MCCDLLKNSYLCLLNNTAQVRISQGKVVVICWKIRIFAYWTTPLPPTTATTTWLWFAEKFVSLLIEQHLPAAVEVADVGCDLLKNSYLCLLNNTISGEKRLVVWVVICWKIRIFAYWTTPMVHGFELDMLLWFAEKFVSLLIEQHLKPEISAQTCGCDLLKNSYLCLLNNTSITLRCSKSVVVICWKIRIFAYWTTPCMHMPGHNPELWFAEKFVSLLIEQHPCRFILNVSCGCDLLKNSYLCLLNNTAHLQRI